MAKRIAIIAAMVSGLSFGQSIPDAPPVPVCSWEAGGARSTCKFKEAMAGTPTSVVGNRVIVYRRSFTGGYADSRQYLQDAVARLSARYGFKVTVSEDQSVFNPDTLADAKVVILVNGEGDVVRPGPERAALEDFQQVHGWGLIWIHEACAFITSGWPFGRKSCVQQYYHHNPSGTKRRMFIDSGSAASPNHGRRNPQSEFLLRDLPGWGGKRSLEMTDEWNCFQAPVRDSAGVNVLFGYDRSSGLPVNGCPDRTDTSETASQNHNMVWTHMMGNGITLYDSWGRDNDVYVGHGNMGDSLLWRFIRYAAKDWCAGGSSAPGCDAAAPIASAGRVSGTLFMGEGGASLSLPGPGRVSITDPAGRRLYSWPMLGPGTLDLPALKPGLYFLRVSGEGFSGTRRIMAY